MQTRLALALALGGLAGCGEDGAPDDDLAAVRAPEAARIVPVEDALAGAYVPSLDPAEMNDAEIRAALGTEPRCEFRYTAEGDPVLAAALGPDGAPQEGVVKLNGDLVILTPAPDADPPEGAFVLAAGVARAALAPEGGFGANAPGGGAEMVFEVGSELRVGYRGYLDCNG